MASGKYNRWLFVLLIISLGANVFCAPFAAAGIKVLADPQAAILARVESTIGQIPEPYRAHAQEQFNLFSTRYIPLMHEIRQERKAFVSLLMESPVDSDKAQAQAAKMRALTSQLQEAVQTAVIAIVKDIPAEDKAKIVADNRLLQALMK